VARSKKKSDDALDASEISKRDASSAKKTKNTVSGQWTHVSLIRKKISAAVHTVYY